MKEKSIKKNMVMSVILTAANFIFPLITFSYVARILTPTGTGKIAFVTSILTYFSYFAVLGIPAYGVRECAKVRDNKDEFSKIVKELLIISLIGTIAAYIVLLFCVIFVPKLFDYRFLFAVMSIYILLNSIGLEWVYQALEEYKYITIRSLIFKIISVFLIFFLINNENDIILYGALSIFTTSASNILNFFHIRKFVDFKKNKKIELRKHIKPILTLFSATVIITLYNNFDISMIGFISNDDQVGIYNAALKIKAALLSLTTAVTNVIIPRIAYYIGTGDEKKSKELLLTSGRIAFLLSIPFSIFGFMYSTEIIQVICGESYLDASNTMKVLMLCVSVLAFTNLFGNQILVPLGKERRYSRSVLVGLFINLGLNFALIPTMGPLGAAIGTLVTEIWNFYYMSSGEKKIRKYIFDNIEILKYMLAYLVSLLISLGIHLLLINISIYINIFITGISYVISLYVLLYLFRESMILSITNNLKAKLNK